MEARRLVCISGLKGLFNVKSVECKTSAAVDYIEMCTAETWLT
jgi:hypothetical protein